MAKLGMIHYNAPGDTLAEFLDYASEAGFKYLEVGRRDGWPQGVDDPRKSAEEARKLLDAHGITASAFQAGNDFLQLKDDGLEGEVERMRRSAEVAKILGTDLLRIDAGWPPENPCISAWIDPVVEGLKRCLEWAEKMDIRFALDNHGYTTNHGGLQLECLARVNSPRVGLNLDTMNYRWYGHDLGTIDRYYEMIAPYVIHVHLKDGRGSRAEYKGCALGQGEINLKHAVTCLQKAGYQGVYCAESEGPRAESAEGYKTCLAWMKANIG